MKHISECFGWFLDLIEARFLESDHKNASLIIDQVLIIRESGGTKEQFVLLADLMAVDK